MRELTGHRVNPVNDNLTIKVMDEPGAGGAHHLYHISGYDTASNPSNDTCFPTTGMQIMFQNGPIAEVGVNGVTHEALIEILIDRLVSFQEGPYACPENAEALLSLEMAQRALLSRTKSRMARGVEGTHEQ